MKKKAINAIIIILFEVGIFTLCYPSITAYITEMGIKEMIVQFQEKHAVMKPEPLKLRLPRKASNSMKICKYIIKAFIKAGKTI